MTKEARLLVLPELPAVRRADGRIVVTQKFIEGMRLYADLWGGPVETILEPTAEETSNLDNIEVGPGELPFELRVMSFRSPDLEKALSRSSVVLGGVGDQLNHLSGLGNELGVPVVYNSEYSLRTRVQIVFANTSNPVLRARRTWWEWNQERKKRRAIKLAQGIQCNGTPTYEAYKELVRSPLLYFDTRVSDEMIIEEDALERRLDALQQDAPLRLAFSGRLNRMKGADHLIRTAAELKKQRVPFTLRIWGGGELEDAMKRDIARLGLEAQVVMCGVVDFATELVRRIKEEVDLFVCCHRQGDPSCTYMETFGCGVPIVGYDNEAFTGILARAEVGRSVPLNDAESLAGEIRRLHDDRSELARLSRNAVAFGRDNTFGKTFRRRIEHLHAISEEGV